MNGYSIAMALLMGATGSLHCAGMCGPIVWIMPFQALSGYKKWLGIFLCHFGRISVYAALGLLLYSFKSLFNPHIQQYVSIALGIVMLALGVIGFMPGSKVSIRMPFTKWIQAQLGKFIGQPTVRSLFIAGILNGLLPCGLVYMALAMAVTASTATQAVAQMYAFGAGTMPILVTLTVLKTKLRLTAGSLRSMVPGVMFVFGCLFVLRGMNLGIPYLSPKLEVQGHTVKASCCHKPGKP